MKKLFAVMLTSLCVSSAAFARSATVTCTAKPGQDDMHNFESFDLSVGAKTVHVTDLRSTARLRDYLAEDIKGMQEAIDKGEVTGDALKRQHVAIDSLQAFNTESATGTVMNGSVIPYKRAPKTPRARYELTFASRSINTPALLEELAPEALSFKLLVQLDSKGAPVLNDVTFEWDGGQGPYYDHFDCK
jgi:hypothetical protein